MRSKAKGEKEREKRNIKRFGLIRKDLKPQEPRRMLELVMYLNDGNSDNRRSTVGLTDPAAGNWNWFPRKRLRTKKELAHACLEVEKYQLALRRVL